MKKIMATLLALFLLLIGGSALAEGEGVWLYTDTSYSAYVEGELTGDVVIPANVNEHAVNALLYSALSQQHGITSLTMPETLYALQNASVAYMDNLQAVALNDGLEVIERGNFAYLPSLTSLTIPASVRVIEDSISSCDNLREIYFEGVCPVFVNADYCFSWLPDDYVIYVPDDQFDAYAEALKNTGDAVDHLQPSGQNAILPPDGAHEEWFVFDETTGTITGYNEYHAYVEIPASIGGVPVQAIGENAMSLDYYIYALIIPEGVERVETAAFHSDSNLIYLDLPSTLKIIGDEAFFNAQLSRVDWSEGLEEIGAQAFQYHHESVLNLPSTLKTIGASAFEDAWCGELHLSGDLQSIGSRAFADTFLSYMAFDFYAPIEIAEDAFADNNIADLDLPWDSSFENRAQYAEILRDQCPDCTVWINNPISGGIAENPVYDETICQFENGVWTMYQGDQPDLTPWTWYDDIQVTALGDGVFKGSQTIRSFYPHHCFWFTSIGNEAFADSTLEYFEPFGSIETIGSGAFRNCLNLKQLTLPASLTSIGADALAGCDNLEELIVLCDPAILPDGLLDECFAHTTIYAAPDATDEQVRILSEKAHRPWYAPVCRLGETVNDLIEMPYAMQLIDDFWYDSEYARLDNYLGYELNLYLPREADGITLSTISMNMMDRARGGDNYEMELPVRSVVIPENYTDFASMAFANCETLETVICYAPLDEVPASLFEGCTNLREVIFVNGVRSVGYGAFYGCESLETVYLGRYVESIDPFAFANYDGSNVFDPNSCITDPALMPDLDALLEAVKSEPMPEPTPEPTAAPAVPVGEAGAPYVGTWAAVSLEMDGEVYPVADMGMEMTLTLYADGTAESYDGEATETGSWSVGDGVVTVTEVPLTIAEDGTLFMEEDGMKLVFAKTDGESAPSTAVTEPDPEPATDPVAAPTGDLTPYVGTWTADTIEMDGVVYSVADLDAELSFFLYADGTAESYNGEFSETGAWSVGDGVVIIDDMPLTIAEDGTLYMMVDTMKYVFVKTDDAVTPSTAVTEPDPEPATDPVAAPTGDLTPYVGTWAAVSLEMDGEVYPVADMGMEMTLTLYADGTAESYDGEATETGSWSVGDGVVTVNEVPLTIAEDGTLFMEEDGMKLVFAKTDGESAPSTAVTEPDPEPATDPVAAPTGGLTPYVGAWSVVSFEMDGEVYNAADMDVELYINLSADGTADIYDSDNSETGTWSVGDGVVTVNEVPLTIAEDGTLIMEVDDMKFILVKTDEASVPSIPVTDPATDPADEKTFYVGVWQAETLEMEGEAYPIREMGLDMHITFYADGTIEIFDGETTDSSTWTLEDGVPVVDRVPMPLCEDGSLLMESDDTKLYFVKTGFTGMWYGCYMSTGAMNGDPREQFEVTLTMREDGTANLVYPTDEAYHWTLVDDSNALMISDADETELPLTILSDGFLCAGSTEGDGNALGGYIIFSRNPIAVWTPDMLNQPATDEEGDETPAVDVAAVLNERMDIKYVCSNADVDGVTLQASMLGGEYSLTFHADGTVDFVMVGTPISGLTWTLGDDAILIDYYGTIMEAYPTEEGFDLDYFDTMLLHLLPEV